MFNWISMLAGLGIGMVIWLVLGYGYAFWATRNRFFAIHALRWVLSAQYLGLLAYLFTVDVLPARYGALVVGGLALALLALKLLPMLLNRYAEGRYPARSILLLRIRHASQPPAPLNHGLWVPAEERVDEQHRREAHLRLGIYGLLILLNCAIIYGAVQIDKL